MRQVFHAADDNAVLLVDASNAFNSLHRLATLYITRILCPAIATVLINTYRRDADLFVLGGHLIYSMEGTTQGDPLAMPMYAIGVTPLITYLHLHNESHQTWYADDATAAAKLPPLRKWWDILCAMGPRLGYFVNAAKTWIIVRDSELELAQKLFQGTAIKITSVGQCHLGAVLGSQEFTHEYVNKKVQSSVKEIEQLSRFAEAHPHAAYCAFRHGLVHKWTYCMRTIKDIGPLLSPLEDIIQQKLIPALTGKNACGEVVRRLLALPPNFGGLGILDPSSEANRQFATSSKITAPLVDLISNQDPNYSIDPSAIRSVKASAKREHHQSLTCAANAIKALLSQEQVRAMELAQERGASSWLSTLPLEEHGFALHKGGFRDASASAIFGICQGHQCTVHAARSLMLILLCAVQKGASRLYATTKFGT